MTKLALLLRTSCKFDLNISENLSQYLSMKGCWSSRIFLITLLPKLFDVND